MAEVDLEKVRELGDSARARARELHEEYTEAYDNGDIVRAQSLLNDFFYWSGKGTSYRGIIAMAELAAIVEDEKDAESQCP